MIPVWSLRLRKVRPPWTLWSATQPQSRTRLPKSASDNSPQNPVRLTHSRELLGSDNDDLVLGIWVEAEAEKATLFLGSVLENGLRIARRRGRDFERRDVRGNALRRRDMVELLRLGKVRLFAMFKDYTSESAIHE